MKKILNQLFPKTQELRNIFIQASLIAVAVYLFLILFQPFGTYTFNHSLKYFILIPYPVIVFVVFTFVKTMLKMFINQVWKVYHELLSIVCVLCISSIFNYFYNMDVIRQAHFNWSEMGFMVLFTFALGVPIFAIYFLALLNLRVNTIGLNHVSKNSENILEEDSKAIHPIQINDLKIEEGRKNFIFAKSEGNYCTIYYQTNSVVEKKLIRISLSNLENQLTAEKNIVRCHRSYLINKLHIISTKGNVQGLKLTLKNFEEQIPVSRNYLGALN